LRPLPKQERKLMRVQRALSRKQQGSRNRQKNKQILQVIHARIANVRCDAIHKVTSMITKTKSLIGIETLSIEHMKRNHCIAKAVSDVGMGEFHRQLLYKALWYGAEVVRIDRFFPSSQLCSVCGYQHRKLELSDRFWLCPACGVLHDRDVNAAVNLRMVAMSKKRSFLVAGSSSETLNACERREVQDISLVPVDEARIRQKPKQVLISSEERLDDNTDNKISRIKGVGK
jgi:putative transposase